MTLNRICAIVFKSLLCLSNDLCIFCGALQYIFILRLAFPPEFQKLTKNNVDTFEHLFYIYIIRDERMFLEGE